MAQSLLVGGYNFDLKVKGDVVFYDKKKDETEKNKFLFCAIEKTFDNLKKKSGGCGQRCCVVEGRKENMVQVSLLFFFVDHLHCWKWKEGRYR